MTPDEQLVATEVAHLRESSRISDGDRIRAGLLERLPAAEAATLVREEMMRAFTGKKRDAWESTMLLSLLVERHEKAQRGSLLLGAARARRDAKIQLDGRGQE